MKTFLKILFIFSIVFLIGSCSDPIFYTVFRETPILKPYIDGSPTNFAVFNNSLYVASGKKIFVYNGTWSEWKKLSDRIGALAATGSSLYALYLNNDSGNGKIRNLTSGAILDLSSVMSIHADGDVLFASVAINVNSYNIYYRKDSDSNFKKISLGETTSWLAGVASDADYYYLCVGSKIYCLDNSSMELAKKDEKDLIFTTIDDAFTGIVKINDDYCAAISNNGRIYEINNGTISSALTDKFTDDRSSTGAIAVYKNTDNKPSLLLVGRKENYNTTSSAYTNGYVEITLDLDSGKITRDSQFNGPGRNTPSSVDSYDSYVSSLGKEPVNHIIQTPKEVDSSMRLLASTQQHGVWSYRDRGDGNGMRWNSEQR